MTGSLNITPQFCVTSLSIRGSAAIGYSSDLAPDQFSAETHVDAWAQLLGRGHGDVSPASIKLPPKVTL